MTRIGTVSNYGAVMSLQVEESDLLSERPPAFDITGKEIDPPDWAIRATRKIGGKRHPKRVRVETMVNYQSDSPLPPPWRGPLANSDTGGGVVERALARRERRKQKGTAHTVSAKKAVPKGNLREEDYRFWKGYVTAGEDFGAQCRWCSSYYKGKYQMQEHHKLAPCKEYLLALFKYAKQTVPQRYCFACKKETEQFRWGIPLCQNVACFTNWKFTISEHLHGFVQYRTWADAAQKLAPAKGPYKDVSAELLPNMGG